MNETPLVDAFTAFGLYLIDGLDTVCTHLEQVAELTAGMHAAADFIAAHPTTAPTWVDHASYGIWPSVSGVHLQAYHYVGQSLIDTMPGDELLDHMASMLRPSLAELRDRAPIGDIRKLTHEWQWGAKRSFGRYVSLAVVTPSEVTCQLVETDDVEEVEEIDRDDPALVAAKAALAAAEQAAMRTVTKPRTEKVCLSITDRSTP